MPKFMLLLHDAPGAFTTLSQADMKDVVRKYVAWGKKLRAQKLLAESNKLAPDPGRVVRRKRGRPSVSDGPYAESKELLGGYFIIRGNDYDAAVAHALDCPHLEFGGAIEIRQVE